MRMKPLLCLVGWHTYRIARTEDGKPFKRCARCGHDHDGTHGFDGNAAGYSSPMM